MEMMSSTESSLGHSESKTSQTEINKSAVTDHVSRIIMSLTGSRLKSWTGKVMIEQGK